MKRTRYIVQSVQDGARFYPQFGKAMELTGWVRRFDAQRFTRDEAIFAAGIFEKHLKTYNAPDVVEVVPASGGARISR